MTVSVRDSAALLDATGAPDVGDPYWAPPKARPFLDEVGANPGKLRIAMSTTSVCSVAAVAGSTATAIRVPSGDHYSAASCTPWGTTRS